MQLGKFYSFFLFCLILLFILFCPNLNLTYGSNRVVSLSKAHLLPKSTGNTQEAVVPSQHDWKIVYRDVKNQSTNQILFTIFVHFHYSLLYLLPAYIHSFFFFRNGHFQKKNGTKV